MKKIAIVWVLAGMTNLAYGQLTKISMAPVIGKFLYYQFVAGGPGQQGKIGFSTSLEYLAHPYKKLSLGAGIGYQYCQVEFIPNFNTGNLILHTEDVNLFSISLKTVRNLKRDFYLSLDPSLDIHIGPDLTQIIDDQTGFGVSLGFGKYIKLNEKLLLNIEPRLWFHNVIPFQKENFTNRLTIAGLNLGLAFRK